tara:strand:+ start:5939 stop:7003 length:1065 start_codon:yes stop_codon:yes gene_type:complete
MQAEAQVVDIGAVSELRGVARIYREEPIDALLEVPIQPLDDVRTSKGRLAITFLDETIVRLTEHSSLIVDEYVYSNDPSNSKLAINFAQGTARFVTGKLGRIDKRNIKLKTPSADIAIRGTSLAITVTELGSSLIMLLPDPITGLSSGEILVSTAMGEVLLNKPFEATTVEVFETSPTDPVILDLTLDLIDNMLIVSPPKANAEFQQTENAIQSADDYLAFEDLDIDLLAEDFLDNEADLDFTELDINYLDVNFLEDLLQIIDKLGDIEEEDQLDQVATSVSIKGTQLGQDSETGIITIVDQQRVSLRRQVEDNIRLDLDAGGSYTVIFIQNGISRTVTVNGGSSSTIRIRQGQ